MITCEGEREGTGKCGGKVKKCKKCGSVGCEQPIDGGCTKQAFRNGTCTECKAYGFTEDATQAAVG